MWNPVPAGEGSTCAVAFRASASGRQRRRRCLRALREQAIELPGDSLGEGRLARQIATEDRFDAEKAAAQRLRIPARLRRDAGEFARQRVADIDDGARLVRAGDVTHPGRDAERKVIDRRTGLEAFADRAEQTLRQLLRAVHGDLPGTVANGGVVE